MGDRENPESETFSGATFSCGYKAEPTAKGWRIHVHCYGNSPEEVVSLVEKTIELAEAKMKEKNRPIAPMDIPEKK